MKYKKYPSYKDSGVEWLGEVPEHWSSIKFKHAFDEKKKKNNLHLDCGSISFGKVVYKDNEKIPEETKAAYQEVLAGEFLLNPLNLNFDLKSLRTALSDIDVVVSTGYIVLQSRPNINKNYLRWLLFQFDVAHMKTLGAGVRQTVNFTDIGNSYYYMPALEEQQKIASFLDTATHKIDTLISKQESLIALLKEKRQAVISHAVTRGLDLHVKLKDSGVEWLGEVPEHWEVKKLKHCTRKMKAGPFGSALKKEMYTKSGIRVYGQEQVIPNDFSIGDYYISEDLYKELLQYRVVPNDILISCVGTFGKIALFPENAEKGIINPRLILIRVSNNAKPEYFEWYLKSLITFTQMSISSRGGTMDIINIGILSDIDVSLPPLQEQQAIATYLDDKTSKIDTLISKATKSIFLLKEKRTALISACVTGKIDVREIA